MLKVHHLNQSRSKRVIWLLEELSQTYEIVHHQRDPATHLAPSSLKAIHPLAKAPVIVDGDITLCESGAIMEYILNTYSNDKRLRPAVDCAEYYAYLEWLHFAEGSLALPVITKLFMNMESRENNQPMDGYITKELNLDFNYIESTLAQRPYFAGEQFSAADIMMTITLEIANNINLLEGKAHTQAYLSSVQGRPAYLSALEKS
ncbi:MAG: glutathione S-transferase [Oceanospirillaceae bacterium]|jgi:glutathione S-transferase